MPKEKLLYIAHGSNSRILGSFVSIFSLVIFGFLVASSTKMLTFGKIIISAVPLIFFFVFFGYKNIQEKNEFLTINQGNVFFPKKKKLVKKEIEEVRFFAKQKKLPWPYTVLIIEFITLKENILFEANSTGNKNDKLTRLIKRKLTESILRSNPEAKITNEV